MATWDLQASAGATGKSILWRGTWSSASSYNPYDAVYSGGSSYISKTNNANKDPVSNPSDWDLLASGVATGAGTVLQTIVTMDTNFASTNAIIPLDDTKPQSNEGLLITALDAAITLGYSNSKVLLRYDGAFCSNAATVGQWAIVALFRDAGVDALAVRFIFCPMPTYGMYNASLVCPDVPGAGAHTYHVRYGTNVSGTSITWNGSSTRNFGGVSISTLCVEEIKV